MSHGIPSTVLAAAVVVAAALGAEWGADTPLVELPLSDVVACEIPDELYAAGFVTWDDTQRGNALAQGHTLWLHAPERFFGGADGGTVVLDGGRVAAHVRIVPGSWFGGPTCAAAVQIEEPVRIDFTAAADSVRVCDQIVHVLDGRATAYIPPSRLGGGCVAFARERGGGRIERTVDARDAGRTLTFAATR